MAVPVASLSPDSQAVALLCTTLALPRGDLKPLNPSEWSTLAAAIRSSDFRRPAGLFGHSGQEIEDGLALPPGSGQRVERLLQRGGQLAFELERLTNRGIWLLTRADPDYPTHYKTRLKQSAPPVLFGAGPRENLNRHSAAIVGSRDANSDNLELAGEIARVLSAKDLAVVSGAARGIDSAAMIAALDVGGLVVGVVAEALDKVIRRQEFRLHLTEGGLTLISPYHPEARFNVGNAMRRNRLIYALAEVAFVVTSGTSGGTYTGAVENLKASWVPLFVLADSDAAGNRALVNAGALPLLRHELAHFEVGDRISKWRAPTEQLAVNWSEMTPQPVLETGQVKAPEERSELSDSSTETNLFQLVWPEIASFLAEPRTERDIAERFGLEVTQARAWLRRSAEEGLTRTLKRPIRYQLTDYSDSLSLLDLER